MKRITTRLFNKFIKAIYVSIFISSSAGLKMHNYKSFFKSDLFFQCISKQSVVDINPDNMRISFDYLKNEHTHIGKPLSELPHIDLIKNIGNFGKLRKTDYIQLLKKGLLDGRSSIKINKKLIKGLQQKHFEMKERITTGLYSPILFYQVNETPYILDGKHRACECLLQGFKVKAIEVDLSLILSGLNIDFICDNADYSKHVSFYNDIINQVKLGDSNEENSNC